MHIAEGILPLKQAAAWGAISAPFVVFSGRKIRAFVKTAEPSERALLGMGFAFTFAATVMPIPVPIAGVSSHMCFTPLLALLLEPSLVVFPTMIILLIQAIFFAHGGLTTLGANVFTLGVVGPFVAWWMAKAFRALRIPPLVTIALVGTLADCLVYLTDAGILAFAFQGEKPFGYWFRWIATGFAPGQLPLAVLEGVMSAYIVKALFERRSEIIPAWISPAARTRAFATATTLAILSGIFLSKPALADTATARFGGLDDVVIERAAKDAHHPPWSTILPSGEGDIALFIWGSGGFLCGLLVGINWAKLAETDRKRDLGA